MSTLEERLRALRQARELLQAMTAGADLAQALRDLAAVALRQYPGDAEVDAGLSSSNPGQQQAWGEALATTRSLIEVLMRRLPASDRWRLWARGVDRHYPEASYLPGHPNSPVPWSPTFLDPMKPLRSAL